MGRCGDFAASDFSGQTSSDSAQLELDTESGQLPESLERVRGELIVPLPTRHLSRFLGDVDEFAILNGLKEAASLTENETELGDIVTESVIGDDGRRNIIDPSVNPFDRICYLDILGPNGEGIFGTGWLASPDTVITAGHCTYIFSRGRRPDFVRRVRVISGLLGSETIVTQATRAFASEDYIDTARREFDYGALKLAEPIGETVGWFEMGAFQQGEAVGSLVNIAGFPGDKPSQTMWAHADLITGATRMQLRYVVDTFRGNSGGPVLFFDGSQIFAVGVHNGGGTSFNVGTRINEETTGPQILEWINASA